MIKKINILALSHSFIKKINLSFYENLSLNKNYDITCIYPKKIILNDKKLLPDFSTLKSKINLVKNELILNHSRLFYFKNIKEQIKKKKPDYILVDNDPVSIQSIIIIFYSYFYKFKIIYFVNENEIINFSKKKFLKKFIKLLCIYSINFFIKKKIHKIFCYSKQIKKNFDLLGYKNKTIIMPLGYNEKVFYFSNRKKKSNKLTISYFGRITKSKGIHILLKSLKNFKYQKWKLVIDTDYIENKNYYNDIVKYLKKNFDKKNYNLIKTDHYKIANYMRNSNIVVIPSLHQEQYGRVIQESVACGNVVIGSNIGAIPEIIRDKDLLFQAGNHLQLRTIIKKLINKNFFNAKFKNLYKRIIKERTIARQVLIFDKNLI